jgi:hypothetical protein
MSAGHGQNLVKIGGGWEWWCMPLIPLQIKETKAGECRVQGQSGQHSEFHISITSKSLSQNNNKKLKTT